MTTHANHTGCVERTTHNNNQPVPTTSSVTRWWWGWRRGRRQRLRRRWNSWRRMGINCVLLTRSVLASPSHFFSKKTMTGSQTLHTRRRETNKNNVDCGVAPVVASDFCGVAGASMQATTSRVNFRMDVRPKDDSNNPKDLNTSSNLSNFDGSGGRLLSAKPKAKFPATNRRNRRERRATTGWSTSELLAVP